jgi:hypothetical protein
MMGRYSINKYRRRLSSRYGANGYIVSILTSEIYLHIDRTQGFGGRIMKAAYWTVRRLKQLA